MHVGKMIHSSFHKECFNPILNVSHASLFMIWSFSYTHFCTFVKYAKTVQHTGKGNNTNK